MRPARRAVAALPRSTAQPRPPVRLYHTPRREYYRARTAPHASVHVPPSDFDPRALAVLGAGIFLWKSSEDEKEKLEEEEEAYLLYRTQRLRYFLPSASLITLAEKSNSTAVHRRVAQLLAFMSEDEATSKKMSHEGILQFLLKLGASTTDDLVARSVASAIASFAKIASNQPLLLEHSSIKLLTTWANSGDVHLHSCLAQCLLSLSQSPGLAPSIVTAGALSMLTSLALGTPSPSTSIALTQTLANLTSVPASRKEMMVSDTSKLLESLTASVIAAGPQAQLNIAKAVTDLTQDDSGKALVVQSGWLEQLVGLSESSSKSVRLHVALALLNLVQADEIATKIMQEFGFPLFTSLADINDLEVQRVVERCLEKLNSAETLQERIVLDEYCVLPDNEAA